MLSQSVTEDIVLICAALQPIITALFWFFQCMGIQAKTLRLQAVRCLLFTLLHLGLYTGAMLCLAEIFPVGGLGGGVGLRFAVSLSCMLGLLWNSFTGETRHLRSAAAMMLLLDLVAVFGFALYFDFQGQEDALSYWTLLILSLLNYICFYSITVRRSARE